MDPNSDNNTAEKCKGMGQPFTLNIEFFNDDNSEDTDALRIDLSENEHTDGSSIGRKRKREDTEKDRHEMMEAINGMEEEIERQLDAKAAKSNLTVMNVKNILRTVITDDYVLNMVKRSLLGNYSQDDLPYEPKLTRAKTKEFLKSQPTAMWQINTPVKPTSKCHVLIEEELPEDSSDEEYQPNQEQEQSEEEKETVNDSDKESSGQESEVESNKESDGESEENDTEYETDDRTYSYIEEPGGDKMLDPSTDSKTKILDPLPSSTTAEDAKAKEEEKETNCFMPSEAPSIIVPNDCATQTSWTYDEAIQVLQESIGQRTRSKFSLSNTLLEDIERAFIPPDITTDMYDSECDDEDWKKFLTDFTEPLLPDVNNTIEDDEEADPEYNVLADDDDDEDEEEKEDEDREELRIDRGVKVSKREVNLLMAELFEFSGLFSSDDEEPKKQEYEVEEDPPSVEEESADPYRLTEVQRLLLDQQMRKHVQLLTQHFLQTCCHPMLKAYAPVCKNNLFILRGLAGSNTNSAFNAGNLKDAINVVENWEKYLSTESNRKEFISFTQAEMKRKVHNRTKIRGKAYISQFHPKIMEIVSNSEAFLYPLLLPEQPFRCDFFIKTFFVPGEEKLLAIGLEQFTEHVKHNPELYPKGCCNTSIVPLIQKYLMPVKNTKQLYDFICKRSKMDSSPLKQTFRKKKAPGVKHFVIPYNKTMIRPPRKQPKELLPDIWRDYLYPFEW